MQRSLIAEEELRAACFASIKQFAEDPGFPKWLPELERHLRQVADADKATFLSRPFQEKLWNSEAVSATGNGSVKIEKIIEDGTAARLLWDARSRGLPEDSEARIKQLITLRDDLLVIVARLEIRRPILKIYRVLAAIFPVDFTTMADVQRLIRLATALGVNRRGAEPISLHSAILRRLDEVLGPTPSPPHPEGVARMSLPWLILEDHVEDPKDEAKTVSNTTAGAEVLNPLPAEQRRRGLLAIAGYVPTLLAIAEFAKEGCTREDMRDHIRTLNSALSRGAIDSYLNAVMAEWGLIKAMDSGLILTDRGSAFLESRDPADLSEWLLTKILGFDHALHLLKGSPQRAVALATAVQAVNPGWKSGFVPNTIVRWVVRLGLAEPGTDRRLALTAEGRAWADRIHWTPESLPAAAIAAVPTFFDEPDEQIELISRPSFEVLYEQVAQAGHFNQTLVARLDAGLWHNDRRHFAVLAGLSGAGKTLLARSYALALRSTEDRPDQGLLVLPVQPGWHDPSALLGYVSPLLEDVYVRTPVLDFLLRAAGDLSRPYTLILDEMNLSHPEQYLAQLLSAMETGDRLVFHSGEDEMSGVPPSIPYPANLVLIGTVNMDETTHGLSDKVLDRACVIDFWKVDVEAYPGWKNCGLDQTSIDLTKDVLTRLAASLEPVRLHFGWRSIADVIGFVRQATATQVMDATLALDHAIYGKILPKLRGEDSSRMRTSLGQARDVLSAGTLFTSAEKLREMLDDLTHTGSARFWR